MPDVDKPATALAAVEAAASREPEPSDSSPDDSQPQPDTSPEDAIDASSEGTASADASEDTPKGPIPFDRHESILRNAREKAKAEALQEWKQQYGWAENVDKSAYERAQQRVSMLDQDPIGFYRALERELKSHPHLGPQLERPQKVELPKPSLVSADGRQAYTAEEVNAFVEAKVADIQARMAEQLQGFQTEQQKLALAEARRIQATEAQTQAAQITTELKTLPYWSEAEPEVKKIFASMTDRDVARLGMYGAVYSAYTQALPGILSKLQKKTQQAERDTMQKKAGAGTVDPSASQPIGKARPKNRKDIEKFLRERAGVA